MKHFNQVSAFNTELARQIGIIPALVYNEISFWADRSTNDGWVYKSYADMQRRFPVSKYQLAAAYKVLVEHGYMEQDLRKVKGAPTLHFRLLKNFTMESEETSLSIESEETSLSINSNKNSKTNTPPASADASTPDPSVNFDGNEAPRSADPPVKDGPPTLNALYYRVIAKYKLPAWHKQVPQRVKDLEAEIGYDEAAQYLQMLLDIDYVATPGEFKPELAHANDIYGKRVKICTFLKDNVGSLRRAAARPPEETAVEAAARRDREREEKGGWGGAA